MAELETTTGLAPFCFEKNAPVPLAEKYPLLPVQNSKLPGIFGQKHASPSACALGLFTYAPSRSAIKPIRPTI